MKTSWSEKSWICAGQSNMDRSISMEWDGEKEILTTEYPNIRLFKAGQAAAREPQETLEGNWRLAEPSAVGEFSAAGFYLGRELFRALGRSDRVDSSDLGTVRGCYAWSPHSAIEEVWKPKLLEKAALDLEESKQAMRDYHSAFW